MAFTPNRTRLLTADFFSDGHLTNFAGLFPLLLEQMEAQHGIPAQTGPEGAAPAASAVALPSQPSAAAAAMASVRFNSAQPTLTLPGRMMHPKSETYIFGLRLP